MRRSTDKPKCKVCGQPVKQRRHTFCGIACANVRPPRADAHAWARETLALCWRPAGGKSDE